jgi:SAM-dependent methyltransferase
MSDPLAHRKHAARLANQAREAGTPSAWFEELYQWAQGDESQVPWADLEPHPLLTEWVDSNEGTYKNAAIVGCGLGDDAELVAGFCEHIWAFDVSPTSIEWAEKRWPETKVNYEAADLFNLAPEQHQKYDLVVEIYTLQALAPESRIAAVEAVANLLKPGGTLVVITRTRNPEEELGPVPWPLLESELEWFESAGLSLVDRNSGANPTRIVYTR